MLESTKTQTYINGIIIMILYQLLLQLVKIFYMTDVHGKSYFDFLSEYSYVSYGHLKILKASQNQLNRCILTT